MAKLSVEIVTPEKKLLSVKVDEAIVPGHLGLFGVRPGHTPFLSLMEPGVLTLKEGATSQAFFITGGFVQVGNDLVRVLADAAEPLAAIDVEAATKRLGEAQERLKKMAAEDVRFEVESATVRVETARIGAGRIR